MEETKLVFEAVEPLMANRWLIETAPTKINPYLFRKYRMFNEGEDVIFKTQFMETIKDTYTPDELMNITDIKLKYLDPTGESVSELNMTIKGLNFDKKHSYSDSDLLLTKMRFIIGKINHTKAIEDGDEKTEKK
jgi:hypothetical protein